MLFERRLGWFAGALRAPFFLKTLRLFYSKASGLIPKASGGLFERLLGVI